MWAQNWERNFEVLAPRENIYRLDEVAFPKQVNQGKRIALFYPVTVSDLLVPYEPLKTFFESDPKDPVRKWLYDMGRVVSPFKSMDDLYQWLGVHEFPQTSQSETPNILPILTQNEMALPMGATLITTENGQALTFGCAACHTGDLFGVKVLGLTNRFPRANEFFRQGQTYAPYINSFLFKDLLQTTEGERLMMLKAKNATKWVGTKMPSALGLDTSLAQVALSLAKREKDAYATRTSRSAIFPRPNKLSQMVADSKPAVWWNVKYKNRWLSDGSIVSGNPVHTNFLWNEIGRGTDLKKLEMWMKNNSQQIEALTAAVFATRPPRYEKFFGVDSLDVEKAQRGQKHFVQSCQKCHGVYEKGWDQAAAQNFTQTQLVQNFKVTYHKKTPVINVGTDPGRYLGMKEFAADLNRLQISQDIKTVVEAQKGYVPPPLEGIWSRWPYFAGLPATTVGTPSGSMLKAKDVKGSFAKVPPSVHKPEWLINQTAWPSLRATACIPQGFAIAFALSRLVSFTRLMSRGDDKRVYGWRIQAVTLHAGLRITSEIPLAAPRRFAQPPRH